ncbi:ABC transporter permease [Actinomadura alba]|uniref:Anibiotic ABC transporter n=1 Tax=Actinomadura alba TaxID=406431 RepID=A0ABR7LZQ6_9ACTN|nr:anibiotic ABC transporter [Actinomadura alba]MBC6470341.1 anibiotic ABC transporter [Actinomadura alba]
MTAFTGTARLTRLALRRDRVQLPIWILSGVALLAATVSSTNQRYPSDADRIEVLRTAVDSPTLLMFRAAPTGSSTGTMAMFQILAFLAVVAGLMSTLAVVRHTRQNEETGRAEMLGATVVGRHAILTAALIVTVIANAVLSVLLGFTLVGNGEPASGSFAAAAAVGATGIAFAAIAAIAAQITQTSRAANGIAAAAIGAAYVVRGAGDALGEVQANGYTMVSAWPSWLSPIGWATEVRPFAGDRWLVLALPLALFAAGTGIAFALTVRRDSGVGMIPARPGPTRAAPRLLGPLGLAWRLQRGTLYGWAVTITLTGLTVGSLGNSLTGDNALPEGAANTINSLSGGDDGNLIDSLNTAMMGFMGMMAAGYAVQALLRLRSEEAGGPAEAVLATATGRSRWLGAHLTIAVAGALALLLLAGVSMGLVYGLSGDDLGGELAKLTGAALVQLPPALILAGFAVAAFGLLPRLTIGLAWAALAVSLILGQLGELFELPQVVRDLSPFSHVPALPAGELTVTPLVALAAIALTLGAVGMALFRRRDLAL